MSLTKTFKLFLPACALFIFSTCKKADNAAAKNYVVANRGDISVKQFEEKVFTDSMRIEDISNAGKPLHVSYKNLPPGMFAQPASISGIPPFNAVFTIHSRPQGYGKFQASVDVTGSLSGVRSVPFTVDVAASGTPCVDAVLGNYTGTDECSPAHGDTGYDVSIYATNAAAGRVAIRMPLGTLSAKVLCSDSLLIDEYNGGSFVLTGVGLYDYYTIRLVYRWFDGTSYNCTTTLTRKPY